MSQENVELVRRITEANLKGAPGAVPLRGSRRLAAALLGLELDRGQGSQPGALARAIDQCTALIAGGTARGR
jgi:hypothetical protein